MIQTKEATTFEKYPEYKDSGVEWLGEIPEKWKLISNKHIFNLKKNQVGKKSSDYVLLSLTLRGIIQRVLEDGGKFPAEYDTYQEVKKGDFVFCLFDVEETPRCVGLSDYEGMITGAYTVMDLKPGFSKRFLYYFYLNLDNDKRLRPLYTGLRNTISKDNFFSFKSFVPPPQEQTAIAHFLDNKTSKIDTAIAQKEQMIALLKERKQIVIQNAVTGKWSMVNGKWGETPKEKMKDSGVEWIGEIPEGWEVKKIKHCAKLISKGTTPSTEGRQIVDEGTVRYIKAENIQNGEITDIPSHFIDEKTNNIIARSKLKNGDILFVIAGATLGKVAVIEDKHLPANTNQAVSFIRPNSKVNNKYLATWLTSDFIIKMTWLDAVQSAQPNLSMEDLGNLQFISPSQNEQEYILKFIENQSNKIDQAITLQQSQIEKLKEYKATLIDGAVTGKIRVTDE